MKLAYFAFPHTGGTYSVFRNLRRGLSSFGVELCWLGTGEAAMKAATSPQWASEREYGFAVGHKQESEREVAKAIMATLEAQNFSGVFGNVLGGRVETNVVRYLPAHLMKVMIVHNITPATYAAARSIREHAHATICVSPRIQADLVGRYGFDPEWTVTIPNGVDLNAVDRPKRASEQRGLQALFLGRIEDQAKGVSWLPKIMRHLPEDVRLTVAGDGPDLPRLRRQCSDLGERVRFFGSVPPVLVGKLLSVHDVFLMPSRFEGYPVGLIEAMAAGCVPVASQISGVTSAIVTHGTDGILFPVGDTRRAAMAIMDLKEHPERLALMARQAQRKAREAFGTEAMAGAYSDLLRRLSLSAPEVAAPLPLQDWSMAGGLKPGLRTYLPTPVKNLLRLTRERLLA